MQAMVWVFSALAMATVSPVFLARAKLAPVFQDRAQVQ
jgi:hypothetical protein